MPVVLLERIPLPSLRTYTCVSVGLLSLSLYYALHVISSSSNLKSHNVNVTKAFEDFIELPDYDGTKTDLGIGPVGIEDSQNAHRFSMGDRWKEVFTFMMQEPLCIWMSDLEEMKGMFYGLRDILEYTKLTSFILIQGPFLYLVVCFSNQSTINMAYCCLVLLGTFIQTLVFGELRVSEQQHVKDRFWNFVFYKFVFVFGVINVQFFDEVVLWCSWFSILGFLHLLGQLGKDRFEYLSFSPTTSGWSHARLLILLSVIYLLSGFMFIISVVVGFYIGLSLFAFMAAECIQLHLRTLHVLLRYGMHLYEITKDGRAAVQQQSSSSLPSWEQKGPISYYTELILELAVLLIDLGHHVHMLLWGNFFLSMATLIICLQIRYIFNEIQRRVRKHRNYLWVLGYMEKNYPMASSTELAEHSDNCAICWERMDSARKLPCSHLFHDTCLLSWLEQDTSCPTCRTVLSMQPPPPVSVQMQMQMQMDDGPAATARAARMIIENPPPMRDLAPPATPHLQNHFFRFDGSRYVSWLPSFSVEVTHTTTHLRGGGTVVGAAGASTVAVVGGGAASDAASSQVDAMARQVQQMFPQYAIQTIVEDLRLTRSPELTIENILEGRLMPAMMFASSPPLDSPPTPSSFMTSDWGRSSPSSYGDDDETNADVDVEFSSNASDRQRVLFRRKERLISAARRRYIEKHKDPNKQLSS